MTIKDNVTLEGAITTFRQSFTAAVQAGDQDAMADALATYSQAVQASIMADAQTSTMTQSTDAAVLAARGCRVLTSQETKYYQALAKAMASDNPRQAVTTIEVAMPTTIIDAVMEDIEAEFPLLAEIDFVNATGVAKWIYNAQDIQTAVWGKLGTAITEELDGAFAEADVTSCKLTAFLLVSKDFLKLGPAYLDRYVRAILAEAHGSAMEAAIVSGTGKDQPIGMDRNLAGSVSAGVYPQKTATKVTDLSPKTYGTILAKLTRTPGGRKRKITNLIMVVNPEDYFNKVMPATTVLLPSGTYANNVLPYPTKVIQSNGVASGKAIVGLAKRYLLAGGLRRGSEIEYSDEHKFLDDQRTYVSRWYGNGRPKDNNAFELLDISALEPYILQVKDTAAAASSTSGTGSDG